MVSVRVKLYMINKRRERWVTFFSDNLDLDFVRYSEWLYFGKFNLFILEVRSITL